MAVTTHSQADQTAVISTEHTLATITTAGAFVLNVDCANMVKGDKLTLRVKTRVRTASTTRLYLEINIDGDQSEEIFKSPPFDTVYETIFTLQQTAGTGRVFPWSVFQVAA